MRIRSLSIAATGFAWMILGGMAVAQEAIDVTPDPQPTSPRLEAQVQASSWYPVCGCAPRGRTWRSDMCPYARAGRGGRSVWGGRRRRRGGPVRHGAYSGWGYAWADATSQPTIVARTITVNEDGFDVLIETDDPDRVATLQQQAQARVEAGWMARSRPGRDPLFAKLYEHREALEMSTENTDKGVCVTHRGVTPEAAALVRQLGKRLRDVGYGRRHRWFEGRRSGRRGPRRGWW